MDTQRDLLTRVVDDGRQRQPCARRMAEHYGAINAANLKRAHAQIESGTTLGKIVLEGFGA